MPLNTNVPTPLSVNAPLPPTVPLMVKVVPAARLNVPPAVPRVTLRAYRSDVAGGNQRTAVEGQRPAGGLPRLPSLLMLSELLMFVPPE